MTIASPEQLQQRCPPPGTARDAICEYLHRQLVGPAGPPDELLDSAPRDRYLLGILFPRAATVQEFLSEDEVQSLAAEAGIAAEHILEEKTDQPVPVSNDWLPSSFGLSFFTNDRDVRCDVWGAQYECERAGRKNVWRRRTIAEAETPEPLTISAPATGVAGEPKKVLDGKAVVHSMWRPLHGGYLLTVTVVNAVELPPIVGGANADHRAQNEACLHQVGLRCNVGSGVCEYPSAPTLGRDLEEEELKLTYRHAKVYAVGHGCSVSWPQTNSETVPYVVTEYLPRYEVSPLTYSIEGQDDILEIRNLVDYDLPLLINKLEDFVGQYSAWIENLAAQAVPSKYEGAKQRILDRLRDVIGRLDAGVDLLGHEPTVLRAFRLANLAMLTQMYRSRDIMKGRVYDRNSDHATRVDYRTINYKWRPFQLAFQLLTLRSTALEDAPDRDVVDLIWFPTGGGKTEAYLAVAAFSILLRRLKYGNAGAGTCVITRYTLSLLTSQQFQRAATLICSCELIRRENEHELGSMPISIGLWIGDKHSPNRTSKAYEKFKLLLEDEEPANPFQLQQCSWCGTEVVPTKHCGEREAYGIRSDEFSFEFFCPNVRCEFHDQLPIQVIDEELYRNPPSFLLATVDKFAVLAWEDRSTAFFGSSEFRPPSLIIQDELHLLSGPLGTTVGMYEAAIECLIQLWDAKPKIIASTATIRRAGDQVSGLFGRAMTSVFPAPGLDARDSYFARVDVAAPGRRYVGVMPQSHSTQSSMVETAVALLQSINEYDLEASSRDAYWTVVVYHNSLRELGRTIQLARADIPERLEARASTHDRLRKLDDDHVMELRSKVGDEKLPKLLQRLYVPLDQDGAVSLVACTNMFSVGVDVPRLGVMLMNGQPKSTSEYIQATSRVGRGTYPGLVVTLYGATRPRDRSHYEQFVSYHSALYKHVEPTSVTPLSPPSRARALHAALVILVRHWAGLAKDDEAGLFRKDDPKIQQIRKTILERAQDTDPSELDATTRHLDRLIDEWDAKARGTAQQRRSLYYKSAGKSHVNLLKYFNASGAGWPTLSSMRNVDVSCGISIVGEDQT